MPPPASRIAFTSDRDGDRDTSVMDADGTNVFGINQKETSPDWQ
jgi:hypothetical protein